MAVENFSSGWQIYFVFPRADYYSCNAITDQNYRAHARCQSTESKYETDDGHSQNRVERHQKNHYC
jgi:hypothetical protein